MLKFDSKELRLTSNFSEVEDSLPQEFTKYLDTSYIPRDQLINYYQSLFTGYTVEEDSVRKMIYILDKKVYLWKTQSVKF